MVSKSRAEKLAELVLDYSVGIQEEDRLLVQFDPKYSYYASIIGKKARARGVEVRYDASSHDPVVLRGLIERNRMPEWREELARRNELSQWCTSRILVYTNSVGDFANGVKDSQERMANFEKRVIGPYKDVLYRPAKSGDGCEVKWNIVGFPSVEAAKSVGMSLRNYEKLVYDATLIPDWNDMSKRMAEVKAVFDEAKGVHLLVPGLTNLSFSIEGRGGRICEGRRNMPDGEVYYGPVEGSMDGSVCFQHPTKKTGYGVFDEIKLIFRNGRVVDFKVKGDEKALEKILNVDDGARVVGEFGIGNNYGIKKPIMNTLFDEKIGGTIHLALGDSFRENSLLNGGGFNKSDIHWDIVCDLRKDRSNLNKFPGGKIYVDDGFLVQENGVWKF